MVKKSRRMLQGVVLVGLAFTLIGCQSNGVVGNEGGSDPINEQEVASYKRAVLRCYKTGGTRVVKISGVLRCY